MAATNPDVIYCRDKHCERRMQCAMYRVEAYATEGTKWVTPSWRVGLRCCYYLPKKTTSKRKGRR